MGWCCNNFIKLVNWCRIYLENNTKVKFFLILHNRNTAILIYLVWKLDVLNLNRASSSTVLNINAFHLKGRMMLCWFSLWVDFTSRLREEGWLNTWTSAPNFIHARSPKSASYHKPTGNCTHYLKITTQAKYLLPCLYWKNAKRRPTCTHRPQLFKIIFGPTLKCFRLLSQLNDLTHCLECVVLNRSLIIGLYFVMYSTYETWQLSPQLCPLVQYVHDVLEFVHSEFWVIWLKWNITVNIAVCLFTRVPELWL